MCILIHLLDIWHFCFLSRCFFRLCHNLCGPGKTYMLLWVQWVWREYLAEGVNVDVSLGGELGFRTLPIKSTRKFFYYWERYVRTDKTIGWTLIKKNCLTLISTRQWFKHWIIYVTFSTLYVKFDFMGPDHLHQSLSG